MALLTKAPFERNKKKTHAYTNPSSGYNQSIFYVSLHMPFISILCKHCKQFVYWISFSTCVELVI